MLRGLNQRVICLWTPKWLPHLSNKKPHNQLAELLEWVSFFFVDVLFVLVCVCARTHVCVCECVHGRMG